MNCASAGSSVMSVSAHTHPDVTHQQACPLCNQGKTVPELNGSAKLDAATSVKEHSLKCWPKFFAELVKGTKTFEIRENDRDYKVGDQLTLREFVPCLECGGGGRVWDNGDRCACDCMVSEHPKGKFTGRTVGRVITYMTDFKQRDGFVVLGLK